MDNDLITIVIPIYKVEKYLNECIESVINQTYQNLEIILVDDGSPDNCGKICDEYKQKDKRIKVIHKKNGGLSDARNCGIDIAQGRYICFVDSDDYIENRYIERLYTAIKINNVKVSLCNIFKVNDRGEILEKIGYAESQLKLGKEILQKTYDGHWTENIVAWNKMYAIELFEKIRYPIGKIHEDEFITYKILYNIDKIAIINDYLYNYRKRKDSIIMAQFNLNKLDWLEAFEERILFFKEKNEIELYEITLFEYARNIKQYYINTKKYITNSKNIELDLIKKYRKSYRDILNFKNIDGSAKIKMLFFYIFPNLYYYLKTRREK